MIIKSKLLLSSFNLDPMPLDDQLKDKIDPELISKIIILVKLRYLIKNRIIKI